MRRWRYPECDPQCQPGGVDGHQSIEGSLARNHRHLVVLRIRTRPRRPAHRRFGCLRQHLEPFAVEQGSLGDQAEIDVEDDDFDHGHGPGRGIGEPGFADMRPGPLARHDQRVGARTTDHAVRRLADVRQCRQACRSGLPKRVDHRQHQRRDQELAPREACPAVAALRRRRVTRRESLHAHDNGPRWPPAGGRRHLPVSCHAAACRAFRTPP